MNRAFPEVYWPNEKLMRAADTFSDETKKRLREDRAYYRHFRGLIEADLSSVHAITHTGAPIQEEYREAVRKAMLERFRPNPKLPKLSSRTSPSLVSV